MSHYKKYKFDVDKYNFYEFMSSLCGHQDLSTVHETLGDLELFTMSNNSNTKCHNLFYSKLRKGWPEFEETYDNFISEFVRPLLKEDFIYQRWPTLRVHVPQNWATPDFHRDSQEGYDHPLGEKNFILPFTKCYDTNTVWTESQSDKADFKPIEMQWGDLITFNGNICRHGNKINETSITRVTYDFRVLPLSDYHPGRNKASGTKGTKFEVGHYYKKLK